MKKLVVVATFAAVALAAQSAAACDWNREASAQDPVVATAATTTTATEQSTQNAAPQSTNAAPQQNIRRVDEPAAPVVLITDHH